MIDVDAEAKKKLIERAYTLGAQMNLAVWTQDEAEPFQTAPMPGRSWQQSGSGAVARRAMRKRVTIAEQWLSNCQLTH